MIPLNFRPFNDIDNKNFKALNQSDIFYRMDIQEAKFDEIHVLDDVLISNSSGKLEWNYNTVMLSQFKGNLEAGNLGLNGMTINYIKLKKRKKEDLIFEDVKTIPFESNKFDYTYEDKFVESIQDYVYALQPLSGDIQSPVLGETSTGEVYAEFESAWLIGKDNEQYQLSYNLEVGDYEQVIPQQIIETIGNRTPYVISNGNVNYRKGNLRCMLVTDNTVDNGEIDKRAEKKQRQSIMKFLTNSKPKIYKDGSGEYMLISILGTPKLSPNNELNQQIYNIDVSFVEIGDTNTQSLIQNGLVVL